MKRNSFYSLTSDGLKLFLYIQPGASKNQWVGLHGDRLKLKLKASPVDGKANTALLDFIKQDLSQNALKPTSISLLTGEKSRQKTVLICGSPETLQRCLTYLLTCLSDI